MPEAQVLLSLWFLVEGSQSMTSGAENSSSIGICGLCVLGIVFIKFLFCWLRYSFMVWVVLEIKTHKLYQLPTSEEKHLQRILCEQIPLSYAMLWP